MLPMRLFSVCHLPCLQTSRSIARAHKTSGRRSPHAGKQVERLRVAAEAVGKIAVESGARFRLARVAQSTAAC